MKTFRNLVLVSLLVLVFPLVSAQCSFNAPVVVDTQDFLNQIQTINGELVKCPVEVPSAVHKIFGDGTVQVNIAMNSGAVEGFSVVISGGKLIGVSSSANKYAYLIELSEGTLNSLISNKFSNVMNHYSNGDIKIKGGTFVNSVKLFFVKIFGGLFIDAGNPRVETSGQPDNCHETYLPGWEEYSTPEVKEQWDQYTSQTGGVCQFDVGTAGPQGSECAFVYQKVKGGASSWLCWYN